MDKFKKLLKRSLFFYSVGKYKTFLTARKLFPTQQRRRDERSEKLSCCSIIFIGFLLYFKILFYELTYLDDNVWVLDYHWYLKELSNILKVFLQPDLVTKVFYRPIIYLSFIVDAQMGGTSPFIYHLTNIVIHIINACLLFALLKKLEYTKESALIFSLIFTVHPVLTQAVVWIPGRTDSLLSVFVLTSFISFLNYLCRQRRIHLLSHFIFLGLALLTKETAIVLPVMCCCYLFLIGRQTNFSRNKKLFITSWVLVVGLWFVVRGMILNDSQNIGFLFAVKSVFLNSPAVFVYLGKVFLPFNLSVLPILEDSTLGYGIATIVILSVFLWRSKTKRMNYVLFGLLWFLFFLLPSLVISFLKHEYRVYLPLVGCLIVVLEIIGVDHKPSRRMFWSLAAVIIVFFMMTFQYSRQYKDRFTFWNNAVRTSPHSPLAHRNFGAMYHLEGNFEKAEIEYKKALELNPRERMAHNNLGLIYKARNLLREAENEYLLEIQINPTYDNVYSNLGLLYYDQKRYKEARLMWDKTIAVNPNYIQAYKYLAILLANQGNYEEARSYVKELQMKGIDIPVVLLNMLQK